LEPFDKNFKEIVEKHRFHIQPNTDVVISKAIRFNDEKVAYINKASPPDSQKGYRSKGIRIPKEQIDNIVNGFKELLVYHKSIGKSENSTGFLSKYRFKIGPNTDVVLNIHSDQFTGKENIFMNYQSEPGESHYYTAKGVTIPFELVPEITTTLEKMKSEL